MLAVTKSKNSGIKLGNYHLIKTIPEKFKKILLSKNVGFQKIKAELLVSAFPSFALLSATLPAKICYRENADRGPAISNAFSQYHFNKERNLEEATTHK